MQKIHKRLPQILGGYWRKLKRKNPLKGFTLVELIVVIVILAILAAILIPGLIKWIDQAKDKKYELEAREVALAAEAAFAKVYAGGVQVEEHYTGLLVHSPSTSITWDWIGSTDSNFDQELAKLTSITVERIYIYGEGGNQDWAEFPNYSGNTRSWDGKVCGFRIWFEASDGTKIRAFNRKISKNDDGGEATDGWVIEKNPENWLSTWYN